MNDLVYEVEYETIDGSNKSMLVAIVEPDNNIIMSDPYTINIINKLLKAAGDEGIKSIKDITYIDEFSNFIEDYIHRFNSEDEMKETLFDGDLYNIYSGTYLFSYNDYGSVCEYNLDLESAYEIAKQSEVDGEYWGSKLGPGGNIYDSIDWYKHYEENPEGRMTAEDYLKEHIDEDGWIDCGEFLELYEVLR